MTTWERWKLYPQHVFIAVDQLLNALIPPVITLSWPDETLSARIYRAAKRGRIVGTFLLPIVDFLFLWQTRNHCYLAYQKEMERRNLPPEYR
jgi:hypothetical protein